VKFAANSWEWAGLKTISHELGEFRELIFKFGKFVRFAADSWE
jgi:hypothetical protein